MSSVHYEKSSVICFFEDVTLKLHKRALSPESSRGPGKGDQLAHLLSIDCKLLGLDLFRCMSSLPT